MDRRTGRGLFADGNHSRTDEPCRRSHRRLFFPAPENDDAGEGVTKQTLQRASRPETREGVRVGQMLDSAHDEIMPGFAPRCKQVNPIADGNLVHAAGQKTPTQTREQPLFYLHPFCAPRQSWLGREKLDLSGSAGATVVSQRGFRAIAANVCPRPKPDTLRIQLMIVKVNNIELLASFTTILFFVRGDLAFVSNNALP